MVLVPGFGAGVTAGPPAGAAGAVKIPLVFSFAGRESSAAGAPDGPATRAPRPRRAIETAAWEVLMAVTWSLRDHPAVHARLQDRGLLRSGRISRVGPGHQDRQRLRRGRSRQGAGDLHPTEHRKRQVSELAAVWHRVQTE